MEIIIQLLTDPTMRTAIAGLIGGLALALANYRLKLSEPKPCPATVEETPRLKQEKQVPLIWARSLHFTFSLRTPKVGASLAYESTSGTRCDAKRPRRGTRRKQMNKKTEISAQPVEQDKFPLGRVIATAEASATITQTDLLKALVRHGCGDWQPNEREFNERSLREDGPIISDHMTLGGVRYRVFTRANRTETMIDVRPSYEWLHKQPKARRIGYKKGPGGIVRF